MCGLCQLQRAFGNPIADHDPLDAVRDRAVKVKRMVKLHEKVIKRHHEAGTPQCDASVKRLADLKAEQFELARQL